MKLGMFMHPIHDFKRGYHILLLEDMEVIRCADELRFDEVWLGEHFALPSEPIQSPLMLFAALIPQTSHIKFGVGVLCLPYQHPAIVAGQAAWRGLVVAPPARTLSPRNSSKNCSPRPASRTRSSSPARRRGVAW